MIERDETFLFKARESLNGARAELEAGRFSNSANRSYYAAFQAAIHAIQTEGIKQPGSGDEWNHGWVQGQFNGVVLNRRHRYSPDLKSVLGDNYKAGVQADYSPKAVPEIVAARALRRAQRIVAAIVEREERS